MNKPTVTSAVSHGHLSREPRLAQPLPTVTSAVDPPDTSAVSHGSTDRVRSLSLVFESFRGFCRQLRSAALHLVSGVPPRTSVGGDVAQADQRLKTSKGFEV